MFHKHSLFVIPFEKEHTGRNNHDISMIMFDTRNIIQLQISHRSTVALSTSIPRTTNANTLNPNVEQRNQM